MQRHYRWGLCLAAVLLATTSIACSMSSKGHDSIPISPNARLYTYFIIVGMVRGAIMTGHLRRHDLPRILNADQQTRSAILHNMHYPSTRTDYHADQKLGHYLGMIPD